MSTENTDLKTDFYNRQAQANSSPLTKNIPILIVIALVFAGIVCGGYFVAKMIVNMPMTNAMKNVTLTLKNGSMLDGVAEADIEVKNCNAFLVKNPKVKFDIEGPDGASALSGTVVLPQVIPIGSARTFRHVKLGKLEAESKHMHVELSALTLGPPSALAADLQDAFTEAASAKDEEAVNRYSELVKKAPNFAPAFSGLSRAYLNMDDVPKALDAAKQAVKVDPSNSEAHYRLGLALEHNHDRKGAAEEFEKALKDAPEDPDVQSSLQYL